MKLNMSTPILFIFGLGVVTIKKLQKILKVSNTSTNLQVGVFYNAKFIWKF